MIDDGDAGQAVIGINFNVIFLKTIGRFKCYSAQKK